MYQLIETFKAQEDQNFKLESSNIKSATILQLIKDDHTKCEIDMRMIKAILDIQSPLHCTSTILT